jgi:hypothetical protein
MSIRIDRDETNKLVLLSVTGVYTDSRLMVAHYLLKDHIAQYGPANCIVDYSGLTGVTLTPNAIKVLANQTPPIPLDCIQVNVAPESVMYGLARMFQILTSEIRPNFRVVRTMKEALDLVGVSSPNYARMVVALRKAA